MPITPEHAFKEKSTKLLILLPLRTSYNRTFQCETPCKYTLPIPSEKSRENVRAKVICGLFFKIKFGSTTVYYLDTRAEIC